ncbi:MAG: GNAT family N-acetyltransferase [Bryobacteraceae bacterium]
MAEKREHSSRGDAHTGYLSTQNGEPVGWCQYGPAEELPRIDNSRKYRGLAPEVGTERLWRITCFLVDKKYRRRGIASAALKAALKSIRKREAAWLRPIPSLAGNRTLSEVNPQTALYRCSRERDSRSWPPLAAPGTVPTCWCGKPSDHLGCASLKSSGAEASRFALGSRERKVTRFSECTSGDWNGRRVLGEARAERG